MQCLPSIHKSSEDQKINSTITEKNLKNVIIKLASLDKLLKKRSWGSSNN